MIQCPPGAVYMGCVHGLPAHTPADQHTLLPTSTHSCRPAHTPADQHLWVAPRGGAVCVVYMGCQQTPALPIGASGAEGWSCACDMQMPSVRRRSSPSCPHALIARCCPPQARAGAARPPAHLLPLLVRLLRAHLAPGLLHVPGRWAQGAAAHRGSAHHCSALHVHAACCWQCAAAMLLANGAQGSGPAPALLRPCSGPGPALLRPWSGPGPALLRPCSGPAPLLDRQLPYPLTPTDAAPASACRCAPHGRLPITGGLCQV